MAGAPVAALQRVPLFVDLSEDEVAQIALLFKERHFAAGETVVKEGADGAAFFLIESGEAAVSAERSFCAREWSSFQPISPFATTSGLNSQNVRP